jgi:hypothetical protein
MMLAEKATDLIRGDTPLPPEPLEFYRHGVSEPPPSRQPAGSLDRLRAAGDRRPGRDDRDRDDRDRGQHRPLSR